MNKKRVLNGCDWHELLDRTAIIEKQVEDVLIKHHAAKTSKAITKQLKLAAEHLAEAYQLIGEVRFTFNE